jgi:hypothetical protein
MICGARLRNKPGLLCGQRALRGKRRCRLHGGLSTGPRDTTFHRAHMRRVRQNGWTRGRPRTRKGWVKLMGDTVALLPAAPSGPVSEWSAGELLNEVARQSLLRALELISAPVGNHLDPREQRRVEIGINAGARILARVQAARMQAAASEQRLVEYEAAVAAYEKTLGVSEQT